MARGRLYASERRGAARRVAPGQPLSETPGALETPFGGRANEPRPGKMLEPVPIDVSADPDDHLILGIAVAARADVLVTGDKSHLLRLKTAEGVSILSARGFLNRF